MIAPISKLVEFFRKISVKLDMNFIPFPTEVHFIRQRKLKDVSQVGDETLNSN